MARPAEVEISDAITGTIDDDDALERLLQRVYVEGGFTEPTLATTLFAAASVRSRGTLLVARGEDRSLAGMVIVVPPSSPARRVAQPDEAEMHLLAVAPEHRGTGLGSALVSAAVATARRGGHRRMVLWTQPTMCAAQRTYERAGFVRAPERDWDREGRTFLVYQLAL